MEVENDVHKTDVAILGGGVAGLWLLELLTQQGYNAMVIEKNQIGSGQSLASQGMIHGGVKYMLSGAPTGASETIAEMPKRWRAMLNGEDTIDLRGVRVLSQDYYMFSDQRLTSKITTFFGSKAARGRINAVNAADYPEAFRDPRFKGALYQLLDLVIDTRSLLEHLALRHAGRIFRGEANLAKSDEGVGGITLADGQQIQADTYIFAAGSGNEALINNAGLPLTMQRRPLHQVMVTGDLPALYAHAITLRSADKPRITISTHPGPRGNTWYLGGMLAESGVERTAAEQITQAKKELALLLPWIPTDHCEFSCLRVDRAEPGGAEGLRPDTPYVKQFGNVLVCWPTKLTLTPLMGDMVQSALAKNERTSNENSPAPLRAQNAVIAPAPWDRPDLSEDQQQS